MRGYSFVCNITCAAICVSCIFFKFLFFIKPSFNLNLLLFLSPPSSGSHFNPPFTIAIYLCGGMEMFMVGPYLISQLIGGVLGAGMAKVSRKHTRKFIETA